MNAPHRWHLRVYYEDTDFSGAVYHASYLRFLERARTEMLRARGINQRALMSEAGLGFVVRKMALDFQRPAAMDDELTITTKILELGGASLRLEQAIKRGDETLAVADVLVACVKQGRATRLPQSLRAKLTES